MSSSLRTGSSAVSRTRNSRASGDGSIYSETDRSRPGVRQARAEVGNDPNAEIVTMPNINALKSMFQGGNQTTQAKPPSTSFVPDAKIRRVDTAEKAMNDSKSQNSHSRKEPMEVDSEKLFDSTNHTQRFKYTRAIFAKMEEQTQKEKMERQFQRSKSPTRYPGSPSRLALSPVNSVDGAFHIVSPLSSDSETRSVTSPPFGEHNRSKNLVQQTETTFTRNQSRTLSDSKDANHTQLSSKSFRAGSMDSLDSADPKEQLGKHRSRKRTANRKQVCMSKVERTIRAY